MRDMAQEMYKRVGPILLLSVLGAVLVSIPAHAQFTDSLWIVGAEGQPGELVNIEVWLQYEGGGASDSMSSFDIPLTWDAAVCTVEAYTIGTDFIDLVGQDWLDVSIIDNVGAAGPPPVSKLTMSCFTFGPPIGAPFVARGPHPAASVDFRILDTATPGQSTYIDTLMEAFTPTIYLGFADKGGIVTYLPTFAGASITVPAAAGDVAPTSIQSPPAMAYVDSTYTPSAVVRNFGSEELGPVPVMCMIDSWADTVEIATIPGLDSAIATFTDWTVTQPGAYTVTVISAYSGDTDPSNDTLTMDVQAYLLGDVGPTYIQSPADTIFVGDPITPEVLFKNFGTDTAGPIPVIFNIDSWSDTAEIQSLAGGDSLFLLFNQWTAPDAGTYSVTFFSAYPADTNMANDTIAKTVEAILLPGDVGVTSITSPPDTVYAGWDYAPSCTVANFEPFAIPGPIPVICEIDGWADTVVLRDLTDTTTVTFADWTVPDTGSYSVAIFTEYAGDTNPTNDTTMKAVYATYPPSQYTDSLWVIGATDTVGDLVGVEVWLQYNGAGIPSDSMSAFNITLTWDAAVCTVETYEIAPEFSTWTDVSLIDNPGAIGIPAGVPKIGLFVFTFGPPIGPPFAERGTHQAATVYFRLVGEGTTYIDTLYRAWNPPYIWTEFVDKGGLRSYFPEYQGANVVATSVGLEEFFVEPPIPSVHGLSQSYPNPMRAGMSIYYQIAERCQVNLEIFDNTGRLVKVLLDEEAEPGYYTAKWNGQDALGQDLPNGIYFYRLKAGDYTQTRKFIRLR